MLSFEEKIAIIQSFPELQRREVSLGRVNYHFEESVYEKKTVVYHLHPNGNGFVYGGKLEGYPMNDKGFVNIRDFGPDELRDIIEKSIRSLAPTEEAVVSPPAPAGRAHAQRWSGPDQQSLVVFFEDELWYVYAGSSLESAFETYEEVEEYMQEEGFTQK